MVESDEIDYEEIGFRSGIELHAQLRTYRKLFCPCLAILENKEPDFMIQRRYRPVLGEMGEYDQAMLIEHEKNLKFTYFGYNSSVCMYELDEMPPYPISDFAVEKSIIVCKLFNCQITDEIHIMRKMYLDGSVTSGFQRTALIGFNGYFNLGDEGLQNISPKRIGIKYVYLEEDAARKDSKKTSDSNIHYKLDRLGFPLVEIVTDANLLSPSEVNQAAFGLGLILKSSGLVRRGLGAIRQDINVSISEGNRVELKGLSKLDMIQLAIDQEIRRQQALIQLKKDLIGCKAEVKDIRTPIIDISLIFFKTDSTMVKNALKKGEVVLSTKVPYFGGKLGREIQKGKHFGTELADRVKAFTPLNGLIHSDENLEEYNFSKREIKQIFQKLGINSESEAFILVIGFVNHCRRALNYVQERLISTFEGVKRETRRVNPDDGTSTFIRDLHGRSRLYPDTDSPLIPIENSIVKRLSNKVPKLPQVILKGLMDKYKLRVEEARVILDRELVDVFEAAANVNVPPKLVYNTLTQTFTELRREKIPIDELESNQIVEIFENLVKKKFSKEALPKILEVWANAPQKSIDTIITKCELESISEDELNQKIEALVTERLDFIREKGEHSIGPLMGLVMAEVRGKIDGRIVNEKLREAIQKLTE
ncbi:MAG: Glu-tRNA(Gln) amidotransferase subunit GatE [Candidatus Hodarchaeales archaeon]